MKKTFTILFILLGTLTIFTSVSLAAELNESELINQSVTDGVALSSESTDPPTNATKLIFIHHSTGQNWLDDDNGDLGIALMNNNYYVSDTNYGWGPDSIGSYTDIGHWWSWFRGPESSSYLAALYTESGQHSSYTRLGTDPGGENQIIMFKSCFPNSALRGNPDDPVPSIDNNPLRGQDSGSSYHTVANAKGIYIDLLEYFKTRQDKLFIVITAPPLTDPTYSSNARIFNQWLVNDWLNDYPYQNVFVFDFYNVLTTNGGNPNINDLNQETGNHHRWWNNTIQHKVNGDDDSNSNVLEYPTGDDHPSQAGNLKATAEFLPLLNLAYNQWKSFIFTGLTINVYNGSSIQAAINSATSGDIIMIHGNNGTAVEYTENLMVNKTLFIRNSTDGAVTIRASNTTIPVIFINNTGNNSVIQGLILTGSSNCGLCINNSTGITILDTQFTSNGAGIQIYKSSFNHITNNTFSGNDYGIYLLEGNNNTIINSMFTVSNPNGRGLYLESGQGNQINNNTITGGVYGVESLNDLQTTYSGNDISSTAWRNMYLTNPVQDIVSGNRIHDTINGLLFLGGSGNQLIGNTLFACGSGLEIVNSFNDTLNSNNVSQNTFGIYIYGTTGTNITLNNLTSCGSAIELHESSNNSINYNNLFQNTFGVYIADGLLNMVSDNLVNNTLYGGAGVHFENTSNNTVSNNSFISDSKDFRYGIYINEGSNNTINNNNASKNHSGLELHNTGINRAFGNNLNNNTVGLFMDNSGSNVFTFNTIAGNGAGVEMHNSHLNTFDNVNVTNNTFGFIIFNGNNNTIINSTLNGNGAAINLQTCINTTISNNYLNNNSYGVYILNGDHNFVLNSQVTNIKLDGSGVFLDNTTQN
ncbi:MAG: parallel beta-helix repeat (two copies), partial [Methanobacterium sp. Maddingley MBC34]